MHIRPFIETDESAVIRLWHDCQLLTPQNNPHQDIARKLLVDRDLFLVGLVAGEVVATVMGGYEGHRGWINYLAVDSPFRLQGYGRLMMRAVENLLRTKGCPKINLQVRAANQAVISFYEAIGFSDDRVLSLGKRLVDDANKPTQMNR
jgi:ribosomal protein S18 acetylase RimI-like enzyme